MGTEFNTYKEDWVCQPKSYWQEILTEFNQPADILSWIPENDHSVFKEKVSGKETFNWVVRFGTELYSRYYALSFQPENTQFSVRPLLCFPEYQEELILEYRWPSIKKTLSAFVHDFNNNLTILLPNLEAAQMYAAPDSKAVKYISAAAKGVDTLNAYSQLIMTMCRPPKAMIKMFAVNDLIQSYISQFSQAYPNVAVKAEMSEEIRISFYQEYFYDLLGIFIRNISENAEQDQATLHFEFFEQPYSFALPYFNLKKGKYAKLIISQQSNGPSKEVQTRMFDPFFSTRSKGKDEGVGLTIAKNMIESADGTLKYVSSSIGCSFQIIFQRG